MLSGAGDGPGRLTGGPMECCGSLGENVPQTISAIFHIWLASTQPLSKQEQKLEPELEKEQ